MILCYLLAIAALNLGLGFLAAVYLRQRYEETLDDGVGFCVTGGLGGNYNKAE
jgi:hypothetical protein